MSSTRLSLKNPRVQQALEELKKLILGRYPEATFRVLRGPEDQREIDLMVTLDVETLDEVLDLVIDRVVDLQVDERLPIHVIPVRPLERTMDELRRQGRLPAG